MPALDNPRWENFVLAHAKGMAAGRAYEAAGYKSKGNASEVSASQLLRKPQVAARLAELQEKAAVKTGVTLESLIQLGLELIADARKAEDFTAASATFERLAKISGHWIDRSESKSTVTRLISDRPVTPMDEEQWLSKHGPEARPN